MSNIFLFLLELLLTYGILKVLAELLDILWRDNNERR